MHKADRRLESSILRSHRKVISSHLLRAYEDEMKKEVANRVSSIIFIASLHLNDFHRNSSKIEWKTESFFL